MILGFVIGFGDEWGYFSLNELEGINLKRLTVERDMYFQSGTFKEILARERG